DEEKGVRMMRGVVSVMEKHHRVQILDAALEAAVRLSHRYIPDRQLPDKAVSLLDTACARVAVSHHATPAAVEDSQRRIEALTTEMEIIGREKAVGIDIGERENRTQAALTAEQARLETLKAAWQGEKVLVDEILSLRDKLRRATGRADVAVNGAAAATVAGAAAQSAEVGAGAAKDASQPAEPGAAMTEEERVAARARLSTLLAELATLQGEQPLVLPSVDAQAVGTVVSDW